MIIDNVTLAGEWTIYGYPLEQVYAPDNPVPIEVNQVVQGATMYEGNFTIPDSEPLDTFLDTSAWGKVSIIFKF